MANRYRHYPRGTAGLRHEQDERGRVVGRTARLYLFCELWKRHDRSWKRHRLTRYRATPVVVSPCAD